MKPPVPATARPMRAHPSPSRLRAWRWMALTITVGLLAAPAHAQTADRDGVSARARPDARSEAPLAVVQRFLELQRRGDVDGLLAMMTDDVQWRVAGDPGVPWVGDHRGKAAVRRFLATFSQNLEPMPGGAGTTLVAQGANVVLVTSARLRVRRNGNLIEGPMTVHFRVRDGRIAIHNVHEDSFAVSRAWRGGSREPASGGRR